MIIDVHAHALHEGFLKELCRRPAWGLSAERDGKGGYIVQRKGDRAGFPGSLDTHLHDMESRLESLRRRGVTKQLVGPPPGFLCWPGGAIDVDGARAMNDQTAAAVAEGEVCWAEWRRWRSASRSDAAQELERAVDRHGFQGAMIPTTAGEFPSTCLSSSPSSKLSNGWASSFSCILPASITRSTLPSSAPTP